MATRLNNIVVCIGSNISTANKEVQLALTWLGEQFNTIHHTTPYQTAPVGVSANDAPYTNAVFIGTTPLSADDITTKFKTYERQRGRLLEHKQKASIIIDLDLVLINNQVVNFKEFNADYFKIGYNSIIH